MTRTSARTRRGVAMVIAGVCLLAASADLAAAQAPAAGGKTAAKAGATPAPSSSPAPRPKLTLKWSTASEVDNYGFFVMRGDKEEGPFKQLNEKVVPGAGNADVPVKYQYQDHDVELGRTYYYYLDAISTQGTREKYSPVLSKTCCDVPGAPKPEASAAPAASPAPTLSPAP